MTRKVLEDFISEVIVSESSRKISASSEYMKKETVRQQIQDLVVAQVSSGEIIDQAQLDEWFRSSLLAITSLKMIPLEGYISLSKKFK
jgi:hypothetical protein